MPIKADWHSFSEVTLAPQTSGVYELGYKSNGTVVYIGSSESSIRSRLVKHIERKDFVGVTHFRFRKTTSDSARDTEHRLCAEYEKKHDRRPKYNKSRPPKASSGGFQYGLK